MEGSIGPVFGNEPFEFLAGTELDPLTVFDPDLFLPPDIPSEAGFLGDDLEASETPDFHLVLIGKGPFQGVQNGFDDRQRLGPVEIGFLFERQGDVILDHRESSLNQSKQQV
jgi:hypothetical protein